MKVAVVGTGYVGLVTGTCLAEHGHKVIAVDNNHAKIEALRSGVVPIYEPGLKELIDRNVRAGRINFDVDTAAAVNESEVVFIAVGTPPGPGGEADLVYVKAVAQEIGQAMRGYRVIVNKSTVPVGTTELVAGVLAAETHFPFDVVSNPEFLREGAAIEDCMNPDRIVVGTRSARAAQIMKELYRTFEAPIVVTDPRSAEMIKYASNAFLAVKISFINEIAGLCERLGADVQQVARGMGHDSRIGAAFLKAGIGYGGSCFPKDTQALVHMAGCVGASTPIIAAAMAVNQGQRMVMIARLKAALGLLEGKTVGILGLAFKPHTDDVRESPALDLIRYIIAEGGRVRTYDPKAIDTALAAWEESGDQLAEGAVTYCTTPLDVGEGADALVLVTEWPEFATLDWSSMYKRMRQPYLFDGRNFLDPEEMRRVGFKYSDVGRGIPDVVLEESANRTPIPVA